MADFLTIQQTCKRLGVSERTLRRMREAGEFPEPIRRNRRWVRWTPQDIEQYQNKLLSQRAAHTK